MAIDREKLIDKFVSTIPKIYDAKKHSSAIEKKEDLFVSAIDDLFTLSPEDCEETLEKVCDALTEDERNWLIPELELSAEMHFIETKTKLYCGVLFALPLMFATTEELPDKLTDAQRWSLENLLKVSGVVSDMTKFCRLSAKLYDPKELYGLDPASVQRLTKNLCEQAADFEDRVEPDHSLLMPISDTPESEEDPIQARMMLGIAVISEAHMEDIFSDDDLEDQTEFSNELARIFNFSENTALIGISVPKGFHEDCRRLSELLRETQFKSFTKHVLDQKPETDEYELSILPIKNNEGFLTTITSKKEADVISQGVWQVLEFESSAEALSVLLHCIASFSDQLSLAQGTKESLGSASMIIH